MCQPAGLPSSSSRPRSSSCITKASLYDVLGVTSSASTGEIRSAYRRLAARYHPDANSSHVAHDTFQALNLAAEVLTSEPLRQQYDRQGTAALPGSRYRFLLDFLKQARTQGVSAVLGEPGADLSTVLGVAFNEAVTGSAATVTLDVLGPCPDCQGSGFDAATAAADCRVCKGSGEIMVRHWNPDSSSSGSSGSDSDSSSAGGSSMLTLPRSCPACRGSGRADLQHCQRCEGEGRVQLRRKVRFRVPAGVVDGQVLRMKGQGHSGKYGGAPGDLLVKLQVYDLADVQRRGDDLHSVLELTLYDALLGASVPVRTVRGHRHIVVPAGVQHGQLLCVQGAGVPRPSRGGVEYGHHYFEVSVQVPSAAAASEAELQLLQRLAAAVQQQEQQPGRAHRRSMHQQQDGPPPRQQPDDGLQQHHSAGVTSQQQQQQEEEEEQQQQRQQQQRRQQSRQRHQTTATAGPSEHTSDPPHNQFA